MRHNKLILRVKEFRGRTERSKMTRTRAADLLELVHGCPGISRADAGRRLDVGTGAITGLVSRLVAADLIAEHPAQPTGGRGRPTTMLTGHPSGPLVLAVSITL